MKVISRLKKLKILVNNFFCVPFWDFWYHACNRNKSARCDTFFKNHEPNRVPEMSLSYMQNMPSYYSSGKYKLSISFFFRVLLLNRFCARYFVPLKRMFDAWYKRARNFFSSGFDNNIYQALKQCDLFSILFKWNIISPLYSFKHTITDCISKLDEF